MAEGRRGLGGRKEKKEDKKREEKKEDEQREEKEEDAQREEAMGAGTLSQAVAWCLVQA